MNNDSYNNAGNKKRLSPLAVVAGAVVIVIAIVALIMLHGHNVKKRQYNEGLSQLESGDFRGALETFTALEDFSDSQEKAEYAQIELDYLTVDSLVAEDNYGKAIEILRRRADWFGDTEEGRHDAALADDYENLSMAISAYNEGDFKTADEKYGKLTILTDDYAPERCMCKAYMARDGREWMDVLAYLYAAKNGDFELNFLDEPGKKSSGGDPDESGGTIREAYKAGDYETIMEALDTDDAKADPKKQELITDAAKGFSYLKAEELLNEGDYEKAMEGFSALEEFLDAPERYKEAEEKYNESIYKKAEEYLANKKYKKAMECFLALGDYKDAPDRYKEAEEKRNKSIYKKAENYLANEQYDEAIETFESLGSYSDAEEKSYEARWNKAADETYREAIDLFNSGNYYYAKEKFDSISSFKDAAERSKQCVQATPGNDSMKNGNGSALSLTIVAPAGERFVYLRLYNTSGAVAGTIFLHPGGRGTLGMSAGTYTIKTAYGSEWYGEKDLFGEEGYYSQLMNGSMSSESFSLSGGYQYTLELIVSTGGNVPSKSLGGPHDM